MPELWTSSNQRARFASHAPSTLSRLLQEPATRLALSRTQPIRFHLDDFVLVDEHTHPVPWNRRFRYALFDHLLRLRTPQPDHPYWTNTSVPENLFPGDVHDYRAGEGTDACLRVLALNREFYDLENRRTTTGRIVGARAAVRNDHPHGHVREPLTAGAGNFDLHDLPIRVRKPITSPANPAHNVSDVEVQGFKKTTIGIVAATGSASSVPLLLLRYVLGLPVTTNTSGSPAPLANPITIAELGFLANWMRTRCGDTYNVVVY